MWDLGFSQYREGEWKKRGRRNGRERSEMGWQGRVLGF